MSSQHTGLISTLNLPQMVDLVMRDFYDESSKPVRSARQLFILDTPVTDRKTFTEFATSRFANNKAQGANSQKSQGGIGYEKTITCKTVAKEVEITLEMRKYAKEMEVKDALTSLADFCADRIELDLTHVFSFGSATSYTDMDGDTVNTATADTKAVFATDHTLAFSSTTYTNIVANAPQFSLGALQSARNLFSTQLFDDYGNKIVKTPNVIVIGDNPVLEDKVMEVLKSTANPTSNNSGVYNPYEGRYSVVKLPYLASTAAGAYDSTKVNYWAVLANTGSMRTGWGGVLLMAQEPTLITPEATKYAAQDVHNFNWTFSTYAMYGYGVVTGKGAVISLASA